MFWKIRVIRFSVDLTVLILCGCFVLGFRHWLQDSKTTFLITELKSLGFSLLASAEDYFDDTMAVTLEMAHSRPQGELALYVIIAIISAGLFFVAAWFGAAMLAFSSHLSLVIIRFALQCNLGMLIYVLVMFCCAKISYQLVLERCLYRFYFSTILSRTTVTSSKDISKLVWEYIG
jgi:hypothetical protein